MAPRGHSRDHPVVEAAQVASFNQRATAAAEKYNVPTRTVTDETPNYTFGYASYSEGGKQYLVNPANAGSMTIPSPYHRAVAWWKPDQNPRASLMV